MNVNTATAMITELGPLARIVAEYSGQMEKLATAKGCTARDWEPLEQFVAIEAFQRVGAYQEVMSWSEYVKFLTEWAGGTRFEMTLRRITEIGRLVIQEIEERHYKGDQFIKKNVIAVYEFNERNQIRHLDIYEQAKDTGRWIAEAAQASSAPGDGS